MVRPLVLVLAGIVVYTLVLMALKSRGKLPDSMHVSGPITTLHTGRGRAFLTRLARPKRFWRAWGNLGLGVGLVVMVGMFAGLMFAGIQSLQQPGRQPVQNPQNVLVIPGVNDFLPIEAAPEIILGLLIALVVHEGGHGLLCRAEDIDIDSMGVALFAFIPVGAFVEPDEESRVAASRGSQTRMFAAGVTNNFFLAFLCFALLFGPIAGSIAVVDGVPVGDTTDGSPAAQAGLGYGDVITEVNGQPVANESEFSAALSDAEGSNVTLGLDDGTTITVERSLLITRAVGSVLENVSLPRGEATTIEAVNGTAVYTSRGFAAAVEDRTVASVQTSRGTATLAVGAYVQVVEGDPFNDAGAPTEGDVIITHFDGRRTHNASEFEDAIDATSAGEQVAITAYVDGQRRSYNVTLGGNGGGGGYLGVSAVSGYSGMVINNVGVDAYPAADFLGYLGGDGSTLGGLGSNFLARVYVVTLLPLFSVAVPGVAYNFAGFVGPVADFYTATGSLSFLGGGVLTAANILFWTAWININLAVFNLVPTFPLDGGHILRAGVESVVARLPVADGRRLTTALTASVSIVMIVSLALMLFGPQLL